MMPKRKSSTQWKVQKNDSVGPVVKNTSASNIKGSGKFEGRIGLKKRLKIYPDHSFKEFQGLQKNYEQTDRQEARLASEEAKFAERGLRYGLRLDRKRGCSSLDMGSLYPESASAAVRLDIPALIPITKKKNQNFYSSLGSDKKTFTQQTTATANCKQLSCLDDQHTSKGIGQRIAELLSKIEKEEGESEEVSHLKSEIAASFKLGAISPKTTLSFYRILKLLGKGSFGKVYMASQVLTNRVVAIKCLDKKEMKEESRKSKIMHELNMLKSLAGHSNVIQIYEVFDNRKYFFFVMEYASGGDLLHLMKKKGRLDEEQARSIFVQLVRGLKYIHSKNILHRDIKLDNILLTEIDGELKAKICDFGVSRYVEEGEVINEQCGTPAYIAPEIIKKKGYRGFSADVWSLGVLLYAMVMGAMPFKSNDIDGLHKKIKERDCPMDHSEVSAEAKDLLDKMLTVDPEKRISLESVVFHPWLQNDPNHKTINEEKRDYIHDPEEFVMHKIVKFGFPLEHVAESIKSYSLNHSFACYMTLTKDFQ